jgi:hypothetical protein
MALEILDVDGMSSEESEGEVNMKRSFHIKVLPWRSQNLTAWLHSVDMLSTKNAAGEMLSRRAMCRDRLLSHKVSTHRSAQRELPMSFYNRDWLRKLDPVTVVKLRVKKHGDVPTL